MMVCILQICICIDMLLIPILVLKPEAIKSLYRYMIYVCSEQKNLSPCLECSIYCNSTHVGLYVGSLDTYPNDVSGQV